jgi:hypothetical protein
MNTHEISYELIKRGTAKGQLWKKYLDFGWICKYRKSMAACIDWDLDNKTDYAVIALNTKGKVVGVLKFHYNSRWKKLSSVGTWVRRDARKMGVGTKLWGKAKDELGLKRAEVTVVSDRGLTLVTRLQEAFPDMAFAVKEAGDRKLRNLKKAA